MEIPRFCLEQMQKHTRETPIWVHFGAGNLFRGFIANLQQTLLESGVSKHGIIAVEPFDYEIIEKIYTPFDQLTLLSLLQPDGQLRNSVVASIGESLRGGIDFPSEWVRLQKIFCQPSLQMVSFTITEKGYAITRFSGEFLPVIADDMTRGPQHPTHVMSIVTALLYTRFLTNQQPIAMVSMDHCSHNGDKLKSSVITIASAWSENGLVDPDFLHYLSDNTTVSFPWTMIDKITPRPSELVQQKLTDLGIAGMTPVVTSKNTFIAPFVNAEIPQYLVIEDDFPNGRPALEDAGVYFTDRETVNHTEQMKVTTCLNPLHTALAVFGCLLGYTSIAAEMNDEQLKKLVYAIGYQEGLPVVVDPKIISPQEFLHEVITQRLPNPHIPDTPQRIAVDTSQKIAIRFGATILAYHKNLNLNASELIYIPLVLAGWLRYLLGIDDAGQAFKRSEDPMLDTLTQQLSGIVVGKPETYRNQLTEILSESSLFGVDLFEVNLAAKVESFFQQMIAGPGAVRALLQEYCDPVDGSEIHQKVRT